MNYDYKYYIILTSHVDCNGEEMSIFKIVILPVNLWNNNVEI